MTPTSSPRITVIMPCYNEANFIKKSINSLMDDDSLRQSEVLVVDGMSRDGTQEIIASLIEEGYPIRLLINDKKFQAFALNQGISNTKGEIIVRADAHCLYPPGYIKKCVELLETRDAVNVGGVMQPEGSSLTQRAIALAMQHPVGVGNAWFHLGNFAGYVDTVYLGTFRKKLFDEIGLYDTNCKTNEDAELNLRILKAGNKIYLDSSIKVTYFPRETLRGLFHQYFNYGKGRCYTTLKHKKMTSWRQLAPVILIISLGASILIGLLIPIFLLATPIYLGTLLLISLISLPKKKIPKKIRILMCMAFAVMHISWGLGFLAKLISTRGKTEIATSLRSSHDK